MKNRSMYIVLLVVVSLFSACENFLDVKPKSQVAASVLFENERGFQDALCGIYTTMTDVSLYGRELTFGMVDVLGQVYESVGTGQYSDVKSYKYDNNNVTSLLSSPWAKAYNVIANINSLIENLEKADKEIFSSSVYNLLLGEALGLRAFLHFDLLRLYAPSFAVGADEPGIPYVTAYSFKTTPTSSVREVLNYILEDLTRASTALVNNKSQAIQMASEGSGSVHFQFTYYAVRATMARVYLYMNDLENAAACAQEVIDSQKYSWTSEDEITAPSAERDRTFSKEQIFALQVQKIADNIESRLNETTTEGNRLTLNSAYLDRRWPTSTHTNDWRKVYLWSDPVAGKNDGSCFCTKLWQMEDMPANYAYRMPLIRLPEMYLILAEADFENVRTHLTTIRSNRGITSPIYSYWTEEMLRNEIRAEYLREFVCEGVMFFYYKRLNATTMDGLSGVFNTDNYVLPKPEEEIEFGGRD